MTITSPISTDTPWLRLDLEEADWRAEDPRALAGWLEQMLLIRRFEEKILDLQATKRALADAILGRDQGVLAGIGREELEALLA